MADELMNLTATTLPGLEQLLAEELKDLGAQNVEIKRRLVSFQADKFILYKANLWCRTAIRILKPLKAFAAHNENQLYRGMRSIKWTKYLSLENTFAIDAIVHNSKMKHSLYVAQLAKDAIVDQMRKYLGKRPTVDVQSPDIRISLFLGNNKAEVSLDSSGDSLHKRGYRIATNTVPLNEVLAAGIIKMSGWDGKVNLIDPMCGSGTFLMEAALIAINRAPGIYRQKFAFMHWKDYNPRMYRKLCLDAEEAEKETTDGVILGSDVNKKSWRLALDNIRHARLEHAIEVEHKAFELQTAPQAPGFLITNPPYGKRQSVEDVEQKYQMIGDTLKQKYSGYQAYILTGDLQAAKRIGLRPSQRIELYNGPIECRLLKFEMYSGSRRMPKKID